MVQAVHVCIANEKAGIVLKNERGRAQTNMWPCTSDVSERKEKKKKACVIVIQDAGVGRMSSGCKVPAGTRSRNETNEAVYVRAVPVFATSHGRVGKVRRSRKAA